VPQGTSTPTTLRSANGVVAPSAITTRRSWRLPVVMGAGAAFGVVLALLLVTGKKKPAAGAQPAAEQGETQKMDVAPTEPPARAETAPARPAPAEVKATEAKPAETRPAAAKPVEAKPVERKPVETKAVEAKAAKPARTETKKPVTAKATKPAAKPKSPAKKATKPAGDVGDSRL
jgi:septal ring-binding cell division protein DamX